MLLIQVCSIFISLLCTEAPYRFINCKINYFNGIVCPTYKTIYSTISPIVFENQIWKHKYCRKMCKNIKMGNLFFLVVLCKKNTFMNYKIIKIHVDKIFFFRFDINLESKLELKLVGIKDHIYFLFS